MSVAARTRRVVARERAAGGPADRDTDLEPL
jgi:hypothetical protein